MTSLILHNFRDEPPPIPDKLMAVGPFTASKDLLEVFAHQGEGSSPILDAILIFMLILVPSYVIGGIVW